MGRPADGKEEHLEAAVQRLTTAFQSLSGGQASRQHFGQVAKACGVPTYWKTILYNACLQVREAFHSISIHANAILGSSSFRVVAFDLEFA